MPPEHLPSSQRDTKLELARELDVSGLRRAIDVQIQQEEGTQPSDEQLFRQVMQGDRTAFGYIYDRYKGIAFANACKALQDRQAAEDCVSETFRLVWKHRSSYQTDKEFKHWFYGILRYRILDAMRRRQRTREIPEAILRSENSRADGAERGSPLSQIPDHRTSPEALFIQGECAQQLRRAIAVLSPEEWDCIHRKFFQDQKEKDIAVSLGVKRGTVAARNHRALGKLREKLGPQQ